VQTRGVFVSNQAIFLLLNASSPPQEHGLHGDNALMRTRSPLEDALVLCFSDTGEEFANPSFPLSLTSLSFYF